VNAALPGAGIRGVAAGGRPRAADHLHNKHVRSDVPGHRRLIWRRGSGDHPASQGGAAMRVVYPGRRLSGAEGARQGRQPFRNNLSAESAWFHGDTAAGHGRPRHAQLRPAGPGGTRRARTRAVGAADRARLRGRFGGPRTRRRWRRGRSASWPVTGLSGSSPDAAAICARSRSSACSRTRQTTACISPSPAAGLGGEDDQQP
jgi:hypothetical protein